MADEQAKANLTLERGRQAAKMSGSEARDYIKGSAKVDKDYQSTAEETAGVSKKQQSQAILGSFKKGGSVPATGNYKLHKGETVVATDPTHAMENIQTAKAKVLRSEQSRATGAMAADLGRKAAQADAYAHGPNGNMVKRGSSAIADHDKDK